MELTIQKLKMVADTRNAIFVFFEKAQSVKVNWLTQESCFEHSAFDTELTRCFKLLGVSGGVHVSLRDRDGYDKFEYDLLIEG